MNKPAVKFIASRFSSSRAGAEVRLIVLHSAECAEASTAAESLAAWGGQDSSWHYAVDSDSITQSVPDDRKAWHAREVNAYSIGIEQAGRASQTVEQWADEYSRAMLERTAELIAWLCHRYQLPVEFVDADDLREGHNHGGAWGITTHAEVSKAFKTSGGHYDPGPNYPLTRVLERADQIMAQNGAKK